MSRQTLPVFIQPFDVINKKQPHSQCFFVYYFTRSLFAQSTSSLNGFSEMSRNNGLYISVVPFLYYTEKPKDVAIHLFVLYHRRKIIGFDADFFDSFVK